MATEFCAEMNKAFSTDAEGGAERACGGMNMHEEYVMQWCTYDINGNPSWWTLTEWSRNLEVVNAQWEKFATRNDPVNPDLGHRLVKRMVSDPEIVEGGEA